jgi:hypothetical protein
LAERDIFNTLASQSAEAQLLSSSLEAAAQGTSVVGLMVLNMESGLNAVIHGQTPPATPSGRLVSIAPFSVGTLRTYNLGLRWFAKEAWAAVTIENTGQQAATYRAEAFLTKTFTTGRLPIGFWGIGERQYDIETAVAMDDIYLSPGSQKTMKLTYLSGDGGQVPEGQDITYILTARTSDGCYRQDSQPQRFGTTYIDENGNTVDPAVIASASVGQSPLRTSLLVFPGSNMCQLSISVQNALETPMMLSIGQDLPPETTVIDAAGSTLVNNHLTWEFDLQPGQVQLFQVNLLLHTPLNDPPLTTTTASAYDVVNATWLQFSQAPVVFQTASSPPPQIQPAGFTSGSFALGLQVLIPGIYRVEATSDFIHWDPVVTVTNAAGRFQATDPTAQSYPARFYRAARLQ